MTDRMNLNMEDLEMVNGGSEFETGHVAAMLTLGRYGNFYNLNKGSINVDTDGIVDFFESKGWNFIPSEDGNNLYVDNNGLRIDQAKVIDLINKKGF